MVIFAWVVVVVLVIIWLGVVVIGPPYVPTLKSDLEQLFAELQLGPKHRFVDLGSGDGRVLVMAKKRGVKTSGVEINPFLVGIANFRLHGSKNSVTLGDMWQYRLPDDTTHVFVFPAEMFMHKLEKYLVAQRSHTGALQVMLYGFKFAGRKPEKTVGAFNLYKF